MMLNVSRTSVPESWLANLATKPSVTYNALDKEAFVTLERSRFSVSTIDSELFPELLSWSALMNALPPSYSQSIPSDITKPGDIDTIHDTNTIHEADTVHDTYIVHQVDSSLSLIIDPTTLQVGFDQSCFDGLDELLIYDPLEAFTEACWLDAVGHSSSSMRVSTPTQSLSKPTVRRKPLPPVTPITRERDAHVDESLSYYKEERVSMSPVGYEVISSTSPPPSEQISPWSKRDTRYSATSDEDEATSFILFEAPLFNPNRYDSVGHFSVPSSRPHRNVPNRIPTFCSNLPATFTTVR